MIKLISFLLAILVFVISSFLFKRAAGTLSVRKLNICSFIFYELIIFAFVGAFAVMMGFRDHYLIQKINDEQVIIKTCIIIAYTMIALPAAILLFNRLFIGKSIRSKLDSFYEEKTNTQSNEQLAFLVASILALICLFSAVYVFATIKVFPLWELLRGNSETAFLRQQISRGFSGNAYIKNLIFLLITPLVSYFAYIYWRVGRCHKKRWFCLFLFMLILSILAKTYDLEKAPVLLYLFYFFILEIVLGNRKTTKLVFIGGIIAAVVIIAMYYLLFGYSGRLFTLSSGPGGRIFVTQIATLFLHVKAFPAMKPYLGGASLPTVLTRLFGIDQSWVRSGRVVMELFNQQAVSKGTAGVMNTLFVGEAYANWGLLGVLIAPLFVALPVSLTLALTLHLRKTPVSLTLYVALFNTFSSALFGGFVDYIYNIGLLFIALLFLFIGFFIGAGSIHVKKLR